MRGETRQSVSPIKKTSKKNIPHSNKHPLILLRRAFDSCYCSFYRNNFALSDLGRHLYIRYQPKKIRKKAHNSRFKKRTLTFIIGVNSQFVFLFYTVFFSEVTFMFMRPAKIDNDFCSHPHNLGRKTVYIYRQSFNFSNFSSIIQLCATRETSVQ